MTHFKTNISFNRRFFGNVFAVCCLVFAGLIQTQAQTTTFAQFQEQNGTQDFVFTNNTSSAAFGTVSGGSPVDFRFNTAAIPGLDASLRGVQSATITVTTTTTDNAILTNPDVDQPFSSTTIIQIIRDTPAPVGAGTRRNLLTAYVNQNTDKSSIGGRNNGQSANYTVTTPNQNVLYTSDFLTFSNSTQRNLGLSFSSVQTALAIGPGTKLNSFTAAGTGTFAANPAPVYQIPTAATFEVSGRVLSADGAGVNKARVFVTDAAGETFSARTNAFGYFRFEDISAGQSIVYVVSKQFNFAPQFFNLVGTRNDLTFVAEP